MEHGSPLPAIVPERLSGASPAARATLIATLVQEAEARGLGVVRLHPNEAPDQAIARDLGGSSAHDALRLYADAELPIVLVIAAESDGEGDAALASLAPLIHEADAALRIVVIAPPPEEPGALLPPLVAPSSTMADNLESDRLEVGGLAPITAAGVVESPGAELSPSADEEAADTRPHDADVSSRAALSQTPVLVSPSLAEPVAEPTLPVAAEAAGPPPTDEAKLLPAPTRVPDEVRDEPASPASEPFGQPTSPTGSEHFERGMPYLWVPELVTGSDERERGFQLPTTVARPAELLPPLPAFLPEASAEADAGKHRPRRGSAMKRRRGGLAGPIAASGLAAAGLLLLVVGLGIDLGKIEDALDGPPKSPAGNGARTAALPPLPAPAPPVLPRSSPPQPTGPEPKQEPEVQAVPRGSAYPAPAAPSGAPSDTSLPASTEHAEAMVPLHAPPMPETTLGPPPAPAPVAAESVQPAPTLVVRPTNQGAEEKPDGEMPAQTPDPPSARVAASSPVIPQASEQPAAQSGPQASEPALVPAPTALPAAPGLLVIARADGSLHAIFDRIYRGQDAPPFDSVAALNPRDVKIGDVLVFPSPSGGWKIRQAASQ